VARNLVKFVFCVLGNFSPKAMAVGYVVDRVALRRAYLRELPFSPVNSHSTNSPFSHLPSGSDTVGPFATQMPSCSASTTGAAKTLSLGRGKGRQPENMLIRLGRFKLHKNRFKDDHEHAG
jgi:hypothetical protein